MRLVVLLVVALGLAAMLIAQLGLFSGGAPLSTPEGKEAASTLLREDSPTSCPKGKVAGGIALPRCLGMHNTLDFRLKIW